MASRWNLFVYTSCCLFAAVLTLFCSPSSANSETNKWEMVTQSDVNSYEDWQYRKKDKRLLLTAVGDFDGDGKQDHAYLMKNVNKGEWALFLKASRKTGQSMLVTTGDINSLSRLFLESQPPGVYSSASCKYGDDPDVNCEVAVDIKSESFSLTFSESGSTTYYMCNGILIHLTTHE